MRTTKTKKKTRRHRRRKIMKSRKICWKLKKLNRRHGESRRLHIAAHLRCDFDKLHTHFLCKEKKGDKIYNFHILFVCNVKNTKC